jgi:hypothetical protein
MVVRVSSDRTCSGLAATAAAAAMESVARTEGSRGTLGQK